LMTLRLFICEVTFLHFDVSRPFLAGKFQETGNRYATPHNLFLLPRQVKSIPANDLISARRGKPWWVDTGL